MSADWPLGVPANMVQAYTFLKLMAQITGLKPATVTHHFVNCHLYENQVELFKIQMEREILPSNAALWIDPEIQSFDDIAKIVKGSIVIENYSAHPPINYPFTV